MPTTHVSSRTHVSYVCTRVPSFYPHPSRASLPSVPSYDTSTVATPFRTHFSAVLRMAAAGPRTRPTGFPCGMQVRLRSQWIPRVRLVSQTSRGKRRSGARPRSKRRKRTRGTMRTCHASSTRTRQMHPVRSRCTLARREGTEMGNGAPLERGEDAPWRMERRRRVWWRGGSIWWGSPSDRGRFVSIPCESNDRDLEVATVRDGWISPHGRDDLFRQHKKRMEGHENKNITS